MEKIKSDRRPIIEACAGGHKIHLLMDTGASVGMLDRRLKWLNRSSRTVPIIDASGTQMELHILNDIVTVDGRGVGQFVAADISAVQRSIQAETGIWIDGLLGYSQMKHLGLTIDIFKNEVR